MFDTNIVVVGNVLTAPEWRRTASTNTLVANFRVASTARRLEKETGRWVDGNHFRVRVNCWRRLAEGVAASVTVGDPVVVAGRLYTRDWTDSEGNPRTTYEMEAVSVGHDLARGRGRFFRNKPTAASVSETTEAEGQIRGETAMPVPEDEVPTVYGDGLLDGDEPTFAEIPAGPAGLDPIAALHGGTIEPFDTGVAVPGGDPGREQDGGEPGAAELPAPEAGAADASGRGPGVSSAGAGGAVPGAGHGSADAGGPVPGAGRTPAGGPVPGPGPGPRSGAGSRSSRPAGGGSEPDAGPAGESESPARRTSRGRSPRRQPVPA
ncbi:hypothetical protein GCM10020358_48890 [Amorphoplanes nipponensis]|uniref:Single-stranded DNA-binding protein n=1 Tax=Actinoplanes nipponensis TaxID=135950 RepID=A0A919JNM8_9ACTN|nr:single-stranded DNA-binding protein [Actinoplanes nipponensis]GIE52622.1 hypothetical protein Ani05nite_61560 [Actinoplanes nipponensis]